MVPTDSLVLGEHAEALQALFPCAAGLQQARQDSLQGTSEGGKHSISRKEGGIYFTLRARILQHDWVTDDLDAIQESALHACNLQCIRMSTRAGRALKGRCGTPGSRRSPRSWYAWC